MKSIQSIINECISRVLQETLKTQRVDMSKINPKQPDINLKGWGELQDKDEEFNSKYNLQGDTKIDSFKSFMEPHGKSAKNINALQTKISGEVSQRAKKELGTDRIPTEDLTATDNVKKKLGNKGLKIAVSGKTFSYGNSKLPPSTMIINITSAFNCPSVTCPLKQNVCYANKLEKRYADTQLRNLRNQYASKFVGIKSVLQLIETYIENAPCRIKNIRISEDGDFENQNQVDVMDKIAGHLYQKYGISTTCYTHRIDLNFNNCKSMIVNMSDLRSNQGDRYYLAVPKAAFEKLEYGGIKQDKNGGLYFKCHCNCKKCNFCYNSKEENGEPQDEMVKVICQIH